MIFLASTYSRAQITSISLLWFWALLGNPLAAKATQGIELLQYNPNTQVAKVYHSFKEGFLLISLEAQGQDHFSCAPNKYVIYQTNPERLSQINGGNLRVSSDFQHLVYLKIHQLNNTEPAQLQQWDKAAKELVEQLQSTPAVFDASAMKDLKGQCWQEPVLVRTRDAQETPLHLIAANLCKTRWCSHISLTNEGTVKLWVWLEPQKLYLAELQKTGLPTLSRQSPPFTEPNIIQDSVPREDLLKEKDLKNKQIPLENGKRLVLKHHRGIVHITLLRKSPDIRLAATWFKMAQVSFQQGQFHTAFQQARFAAWLNPAEFNIRYFALSSLARYGGIQEIFSQINTNFPGQQRQKACAKMHLDPNFKKLKRQQLFLEQFGQSCPTGFSPSF